MNICFSFLSFAKDLFGGIEKSIYNLSIGLIKNGHNVSVFTSFMNSSELDIDGIYVHRSKNLPTSLSGNEDLDDLAIYNLLTLNSDIINREFDSICSQQEIDFVIVVDPLWGILQTTNYCAKRNIKILLWLHVLNSNKLLLKAASFNYSIIICVSDFLKNLVLSRQVFNNIIVISNSIILEEYNQNKVNKDDSKFLFCNCRLSPEKGVDYLLHEFRVFLNINPEFSLILCGGEPAFGSNHQYKIFIQDLINKLDLESNTIILPNLKWNTIPSIYNKSLISIFPTKFESFGLAAIESLATGTPLIVNEVCDLKKITEENAIFVDCRKKYSISSSLTLLVNDSQLYTRLRKLGMETAKLYDSKIIANKFVDAYFDYL